MQSQLAAVSDRPVWLRAPLPRCVQAVRVWTVVALHVGDEARLVHHPVVLVLAPVIEPANDLSQVVDPRPGDSRVGDRMVPGAHEQLARSAEALHEPEGRGRVAVAPAADHEYRA